MNESNNKCILNDELVGLKLLNRSHGKFLKKKKKSYYKRYKKNIILKIFLNKSVCQEVHQISDKNICETLTKSSHKNMQSL